MNTETTHEQLLWTEFNTISLWDYAEMEEFIYKVRTINEELATEMSKQYAQWRAKNI